LIINNTIRTGSRSNKYNKSGFANLNNCILLIRLSKVSE
jgi:hypothetical protein